MASVTTPLASHLRNEDTVDDITDYVYAYGKVSTHEGHAHRVNWYIIVITQCAQQI